MSNELVVRQSMALTFDEMTRAAKAMADVPEYEGLYTVSNGGRVYSLPRNTTPGRELKPEEARGGYLQVTLYKNGARKRHKVHRLVLAAFIGQSSLDVNHKNGNRADNRLSNLEYVTPKENTDHAMNRVGPWQLSGEDHPMAKLDKRQVAQIKALVRKMTQRDVAKKFGISEAQVSRIINGRRWNNV